MRLPRTFFFRLDCHQAAIAIGIFELFFQVPFVFFLKFFYIVATTSDLVRKDAEKINEEQDLSKFASGVYVIAIIQAITIIGISLMLYAAIERKKRWFMLPWFVFTVFSLGTLVSFYFEVIEVVSTMSSSALSAIFWWTAMILTIIGTEIYKLLSVYCSFREIGLANDDVPNTDTSVQFHALDDSNAAGVV